MSNDRTTTWTLEPQLELVLRAATADPDRATEAARAFLAGFEPDGPLDPRVHAAVPAVYARLSRAARSDDPRWKLVSGVARQVWTRNQMRLTAVRSALEALDKVGAPPLVLPGAITGMAALDDTRARALERVDLLVRPDHVPRVTAALVVAGATIRQDHEPLLDGRLAWQPLVYVELSEGALVVRWDHPVLDASVLDTFRGRSLPLRLGPLVSSTLAPLDALVTVLADLTETGPGPGEWTNLVLEAARLRRMLGTDRLSIEHLARVAHEVDAHDEWTDLLTLLAHVSDDRGDREAADVFAAVRQPVAAPSPRVNATAHPARAWRVVRQYRRVAEGRNEPVTIRGLARYLTVRWQLDGGRSLPGEALRRLLRARRPQSPSGAGAVGTATSAGGGSVHNSSATLASSTLTE